MIRAELGDGMDSVAASAVAPVGEGSRQMLAGVGGTLAKGVAAVAAFLFLAKVVAPALARRGRGGRR